MNHEMNLPLVSVVIPVYNVEKYLSDCLESVLQQNFEGMEIFCVDDCSTDGSRDILDQYAARDKRIRIIRYEKNGGLSYARNQAMKQAKGQYIFFLDSDDMMAEGALQVLYERASSQWLDVLGFDTENVYEKNIDASLYSPFGIHSGKYDGIDTGQRLFVQQMKQGDYFPMACAYFWRTEFLRKHDLWFHEGILHEDNPFTFQAMMFAERMAVLPKTCYIYRRRADSITTHAISETRLTGFIAGINDVIHAIAEFPIEMASQEWMRAAMRYLSGQKMDARHHILQYHRMHPQRMNFLQHPDWNLVYQRLLSGNYQFVRGILENSVLDRLEITKLILIYGAGKIGWEVLHLLEEYGIHHYAVVVTRKTGNQEGFSGLAKELCEYQPLCEDAFVIVATGNRLHGEMEIEAKRQGFQHIIWYKDLMG